MEEEVKVIIACRWWNLPTCKVDERFMSVSVHYTTHTRDYPVRGTRSLRTEGGSTQLLSHSTLFFLSLLHTHSLCLSPFVPFSISSLLYTFKRHEVAAIAQDRAWHCCLPIHTVPADDFHFSNASITTAATATTAAIFIDIATDYSLFDYPIASLIA